jgi:D-alanine-D-alanine ligase
MRITVLTYLDEHEDGPPDEVVGQVSQALRHNGHEVSVLGVHADLDKLIRGLRDQRPELCFNLLEMFGDNVCGNIPVVGLLDLLGVRYTGCGAGEFYLGQDKALAKKLLAFENLLYPRFAVFSKDADFETGGNLRMPLFVKPLNMDASIGIDQNGLVHDALTLMKRVVAIHQECQDAALAEEYIEGREFYVGVLGNNDPTVLPPIEMDFSGLPEGAPRIMDAKAKFDETSAEYKGTKAVLAQIPDELRAKLQKVSLEAYRSLRVRDYGRVDLRVTDTGEIYVLEVNASCYLEKASEFATAAKAAGIEYNELIQRIVELAVERYRRLEMLPRGSSLRPGVP